MRIDAKYEKIVTYIRCSKEIMQATHPNDWLSEKLTYSLYGKVLTASKETGTIPVYVERPSFLDWLFRRTKTITVPYTIRQLMKVDKIPDSLPVIEFGPQITPTPYSDIITDLPFIP